jgi:hypothetical protein
MDKTSLGDRIKGYEHVSRTVLSLTPASSMFPKRKW